MDGRTVVRIVVGGRVQGVGFRHFIAERAMALGLAGWVRNRFDRSVECVVSGAPEAVEAMVIACRRGPLSARVDRCDVSPADEADLADSRPDRRFAVLATR